MLKLCINCKHYKKGKDSFWSSGYHYCEYPSELINPVDGKDQKHPPYACLEFRSFGRYCGFNARFFEPNTKVVGKVNG